MYATLQGNVQVELDVMQPHEQEMVRALLNEIIEAGQTYPQDHALSAVEFAAYWMSHSAFVVRAVGQIPLLTHQKILGAFFIKPNFPGRCSHISNAGFIVHPAARGWGIGRWMGETMLKIAHHQGYRAVMFNLVFSTNLPSINLWKSLGFETIARLPQAAHLKDGTVADALMMYRSLP
ncbi:MAG: GNAT family N-acetyltransferase [Scytolyngbya sp. HA4215-MV1]|nr:GNAT family N-acetyltransferase [Scytolyngbya sp. HA4215-MV1]